MLHNIEFIQAFLEMNYYPVDIGRKINVNKTFNLRPVSMG